MMSIEEFFLYALLAGGFFALAAGPLGSFMIWRRLSFFGDTLAHASLSGIVLALWLDLNPLGVVMGMALLMSLCLVRFHRSSTLSYETWLAILSHGFLALGLFALALSPHASTNLSRYLFGDILAVSEQDLGILAGVCVVTLALVGIFWRRFLAITIHEDLARVSGLPVERLKILLTLLMAINICVATKFLGVLLITALLIFPASAARYGATTPLRMALWASLLGVIGVAGGLMVSAYLDTPASPSIAVVNLGILVLAGLRRKAF